MAPPFWLIVRTRLRTNAYALNTQVLKVVLQVKMGKEFNSIDFQEANYSYVKKSMLPELLDYIDNNWPLSSSSGYSQDLAIPA